MIIWTGWGLLGLVLAIVPSIAFESVLNSVMGPAYYRTYVWPKALSWMIAAAAIWIVGTCLAARPGRTVIDKETGQEIILRQSHTLFWVPLRYWAVPVTAFAFWALSDGLSRGPPLWSEASGPAAEDDAIRRHSFHLRRGTAQVVGRLHLDTIRR